MKVDIVNKTASSPEELIEVVHGVMHLVRAEQYRNVRDAGLTLTHVEGKILSFFESRPGSTLSDLVNHTGKDKGQLARLIKVLKEQGLLEAQPSGEDRRSVSLKLTPEGKTVHQSLQAQLRRVARRAVKGMDGAQRQQLLMLLEKLRVNLVRED